MVCQTAAAVVVVVAAVSITLLGFVPRGVCHLHKAEESIINSFNGDGTACFQPRSGLLTYSLNKRGVIKNARLVALVVTAESVK